MLGPATLLPANGQRAASGHKRGCSHTHMLCAPACRALAQPDCHSATAAAQSLQAVDAPLHFGVRLIQVYIAVQLQKELPSCSQGRAMPSVGLVTRPKAAHSSASRKAELAGTLLSCTALP